MSDRFIPLGGFQYRCSRRHWVVSYEKDYLEETKCTAVFSGGIVCDGILGVPLVDWDFVYPEIERLNAAIEDIRVAVALPDWIDGSEVLDRISQILYVLDHERY